MSTVPEVNAKLAMSFLEWRFGEEFEGKVYVFGLRGKSNGEKDTVHRGYASPGAIDDMWWEEKCKNYNVTYGTSTVKEVNYNAKEAANTVQITALWFDIDAPKKMFTGAKELIVTGAEFFSEVKAQDTHVGMWVRSSEHGVQGYIKLAEPIDINGDKEYFDTKIAPMLWDIMWYYGGDPKVVHLGALMRLPGTLNVKKEYDKRVLVTCQTIDIPPLTIGEVKTAYPQDFDAVPRVFAYAFIKLLQDIWTDGHRHDASLWVAGTARKCGLDKASVKRLYKDLVSVLGGDEDQVLTNVDTTYEHDIDSLATLHLEDADLAEGAESIIKLWMELKKVYAKKRGFDYHPEVDPTKSRSSGDLPFRVVDGETYYRDDQGNTRKVANFSIQVLKRIRKSTDRSITWVAELTKGQSDPVIMEIPTEKHNSWAKFSTIKPHVSGIGFEPALLWTSYIMQLDEESRETPLVNETPYYGVLNAETAPTLFLPGQDRTDFTLPPGAEEYDTALPGALTLELTKEEKARYLMGLAEHYPVYHDLSYAIPALGWFCGCPLVAFMRNDPLLEGFPTLMVSGLKGVGKSTIITQGIAPHFGCAKTKGFNQGGTTAFSIKRRLSSNNICPYVLDEFKDEHEVRTQQLQGLIRALWNGYDTESGLASGGIRTDHLQAPLCVIGEHTYSDEATLDRTFIIRVAPGWVKGLREASNKRLRVHAAAQAWLHSPKHRGVLGSMLLDYMDRHLDSMGEIIKAATRTVEETCNVNNERKRKGYIAVFSGIYLLKSVFVENGVKFPFKKEQLVEAIYSADPDVREDREPGGGTMKALFTATDQAIVDGIRRRASHYGLTYAFNQATPELVFFQLNRWFDMITPYLKGSHSAALRNLMSFEDMLFEQMDEEGTPVEGVEDTGFFASQNVAINIKRVRELYKVDTEAWKRLNPVEDEE